MTAVQMGVMTFNERALIPTDQHEWNLDESRLFRYAYNEAMYNNKIYQAITSFSNMLKLKGGLYKFTQGIYNPVYRRVEADVGKLFAGPIDYEDMSRGSMALQQADDSIKGAIKQGFLWSNWGEEKSLLVRLASMLGDVAIKIVDDGDKCRMEVLHPGKIHDAEFDAVGNVKKCVIEYERYDTVIKKWYMYREEITQEEFAFFRDNKPWDYIHDVAGGAASRYPNIYGFIPVVIIKYKDMGQKWGASSFHAQIDKIHILNDEASLLHDQIRKAINLMWYFAGVQKKTELTASTEDKDQVPAIYGPADSQPFPMVGNVDLTAARENIVQQILEIERDNPVLAMPRIREGGNLTKPGVLTAYSDALGEFTEAWGRLSSGLVRALKMLISIGGIRKYEGFQGFDIHSFDKGDLEIMMKLPEFVQDQLSKLERLQMLQSIGVPTWLILREMDVDEDTIAEVQAEDEKNRREAMRGFAEGVFTDDEDDDGTATEADEEADAEKEADARAAALPNAA